jgi:hypothetical protein
MFIPASPLSPPFTKQAHPSVTPEQKAVINHAWMYLNPNLIQWSTYQFPPYLSSAQKLCINVITKFYQRYTRGEKKNTVLGKIIQKRAGNPTADPNYKVCNFQKLGKLSCSEYTAVMIGELGVIPKLKASLARARSYNFAYNADAPLLIRKNGYQEQRPYFTPVLI